MRPLLASPIDHAVEVHRGEGFHRGDVTKNSRNIRMLRGFPFRVAVTRTVGEMAMKKIVLAAAAMGFAAPLLAQEETEMSMEEVPQAVMEAAQAEAESAGAELTSAAMDGETYELSGTLENGMGFEVDVLENGTVEEVEEEIEMSEVPEEVATALEENLPGFEPTYIERSTREDGAQIVYEFEGTHEDGEVDVEINEDGSNFTINEDAAG